MSIRLLLDENTSWRLSRLLDTAFDDVVHVSSTELGESSADTAIWEYARKHGQCIVTNDDDFHMLSAVRGFPPKVILLRMGNQSTRYVADVLLNSRAQIEQFLASEEYGVLEIL